MSTYAVEHNYRLFFRNATISSYYNISTTTLTASETFPLRRVAFQPVQAIIIISYSCNLSQSTIVRDTSKLLSVILVWEAATVVNLRSTVFGTWKEEIIGHKSMCGDSTWSLREQKRCLVQVQRKYRPAYATSPTKYYLASAWNMPLMINRTR